MAARPGALPGPPQYVEEWPFGLCLGVVGHYVTYFGGLGSHVSGLGSGLCHILIRARYEHGSGFRFPFQDDIDSYSSVLKYMNHSIICVYRVGSTPSMPKF